GCVGPPRGNVVGFVVVRGHQSPVAARKRAQRDDGIGWAEVGVVERVCHMATLGRFSLVATRIGDGVLEIDTLLGGWERVTAGYLVEGPAPVLIETGSQSSVPALLGALQDLGVSPND